MASFNIPRTKDDPNYRYKMPRLIIRTEGRGNGIRTNISNMGDLARSLKRPPQYITKFLGCELGATAKFEEAEEKALINGSHNEKTVNIILDKFIDMYVICENCQLPEMDISVKKGSLYGKCNACGFVGGLDIVHKAATFMIKNPPDQDTSTMGKKKTERREKKLYKEIQNQEAENSIDTEKKEKEKKKKKKDKIKKKASQEIDLDEEFEELDEKKKKKKNLHKEEKDDFEIQEELVYESVEIDDTINRLKTFISNQEKHSVEEILQELRILQVAQQFNSKCKVYIIYRVIFDNELTASLLENQMEIMKSLCDNSVHYEDLIDATQYFIHEHASQSLPSFPYVIQSLYNASLLEEGEIIDYYRKENNDAIFTRCKEIVSPLINWFEDNESDEETTENPVSSEKPTQNGEINENSNNEVSTTANGSNTEENEINNINHDEKDQIYTENTNKNTSNSSTYTINTTKLQHTKNSDSSFSSDIESEAFHDAEEGSIFSEDIDNI